MRTSSRAADAALLTRVRYLLRINTTSGRLFWRRPPKNHPDLLGKEAGNSQLSRAGKCYWVVQIDGVKFKRSRLIFLAARGRLPYPQADHKNGNSLDDRRCNLREATIYQNAWNHKTRKRRIDLPMGVRISASSGRYQARIIHHGRTFYLGTYTTPSVASGVYQKKRKELFGEFA